MEATPNGREQSVSADRDGTGLGILVVEDNIDCASSTAMVLRMYGHEVRVALDGQAAVRATGDFRPDVVLLDIGLPGMDGYAVATAIKRFERWPNEKRPLIIAVSGFAKAADCRSEEAGIDLYLLKPVDPVQLQQLLSRFQLLVGNQRRSEDKLDKSRSQ